MKNLPVINPEGKGGVINVSIFCRTFKSPVPAVGVFVRGATFTEIGDSVDIGDTGPATVLMCAGVHIQAIIDMLRDAAEEIGVTVV